MAKESGNLGKGGLALTAPREVRSRTWTEKLAQRHLYARLDGDRLLILPADRVTDEIAVAVAANKAEIVAELRAEVASVGTAGQEAPRYPTAQPGSAVKLHPAVESRCQQDLQAGERLQPGFYVLESGIWRAMEEGRISGTQAEEHFERLYQSVDLFRISEPQASQSVAVGN